MATTNQNKITGQGNGALHGPDIGPLCALHQSQRQSAAPTMPVAADTSTVIGEPWNVAEDRRLPPLLLLDDMAAPPPRARSRSFG